MRGRKPLPSRVKELRNTVQQCRTNPNEPKPWTDRIDPPSEMDHQLRPIWDRFVDELTRSRMITNVDIYALEALCVAYGRWKDANSKIESTGLLVKTPNGFPVQSPYLAIANKAHEQMVKLMVEFGITPSSRARVSTAIADDESNPFRKHARPRRS